MRLNCPGASCRCQVGLHKLASQHFWEFVIPDTRLKKSDLPSIIVPSFKSVRCFASLRFVSADEGQYQASALRASSCYRVIQTALMYIPDGFCGLDRPEEFWGCLAHTPPHAEGFGRRSRSNEGVKSPPRSQCSVRRSQSFSGSGI